MRYIVTLPGGRELEVDVARRAHGEPHVSLTAGPTGVPGSPASIDGRAIAVHTSHVVRGTRERAARVSAVVGTRSVDLWLDGRAPVYAVAGAHERFTLRVESARARQASAHERAADAGPARVASPMPGRVVKVLVAPGDAVVAGQPVVVVEAMKMENELASERAGTVHAVHCQAGQSVDGGATLVEIA